MCCLETPFRTEALTSSAAGTVVSWWLPAKGSHLAEGQTPFWEQPASNNWWGWGTTLLPGVTALKGSSRSGISCGIGWGLFCDCTVDQLFPLPSPPPSLCHGCGYQGHLQWTSGTQTPFSGTVFQGLALITHLWYLPYLDCLLPLPMLSFHLGHDLLEGQETVLDHFVCPRGPRMRPCT